MHSVAFVLKKYITEVSRGAWAAVLQHILK